MLNNQNALRLRLWISAALLALFLFGCGSKDDLNMQPALQNEDPATADAAAAVAAEVAVNNGGVLDQANDLIFAARFTSSEEDPYAIEGFPAGIKQATREYDSLSGWWTVTVTKEIGHPWLLYYSTYTREYKHQFLNKNGRFQRFYITPTNSGCDTAYSLHSLISDASGYTFMPRLTHTLTGQSGDWLITGINTPEITINSMYGKPFVRTSVDTLTRVNSMRILEDSLSLQFFNVTGAKGGILSKGKLTGGTITGHYHAIVTFKRGDAYAESTIDRDIVVTLGEKTTRLKVGIFEYLIDSFTGDLL
ncbi:MAG: hypothetical protein LWX56_00810 [Ignavibacteria bacterium]|nr:hypothetical protein [Ignavibacteria bacterium]